MPTQYDPTSEAEFSVVLGGDFGQYYFTKFSGGDRSRDSVKYPLADRNQMGSIVGMRSYGDIKLETEYIPEVHDDLDAKISRWCGEKLQVQVSPLQRCNINLEQRGKIRTYTGCKPKSESFPAVDRGGNRPSTYSIELTVQDMEIQ
jgi:hypothetical protein